MSKTIITACIIVLLFGANANSQTPTILASTGVPDGPAHTVLVKGAVLHLQLNSLDKLTTDINNLVMQFVPQEAVPAQFQELLSQPKPLLSFLGLQTIGTPLTADVITKMMGVDVTRPISVTVYVGNGLPSYVIAIPVADYRRFTGMLRNITIPQSFKLISAGSATYYQVSPTKPNIPKSLYVACSSDTAYICTSQSTAQALGSAPLQARISPTDFLSKFTVQSKDADIVIAADTFMLKQFLPMVEQSFMTIPPQQIAQLRNSIPSQMRTQFDMRIRMQSNFESLDEFLDYAEAFIGATYEVFVKEVVTQVKNSRGLGLALNIDKTYQSIKVSVHSDLIKPSNSMHPIPVKETMTALAKLPGPKNLITIYGQKPAKKFSPHLKDWIEIVKQKMLSKNHQSDSLDLFLSNLQNAKPSQSLETLAPWTVSSWLGDGPIAIPQDATSIMEFIDKITPKQQTLPVKTMIMPINSATLKKHIIAEALKVKSNLKNESALEKKITKTEPFLIKEISLSAKALGKNGITMLTESRSYRTRMGYFGYDEHELVNRNFTLFRDDGNSVCIEKGRREPRWLDKPNFGKSTPLRQSITGLMRMAPKNVNAVEIITNDDSVSWILDLFTTAERVIHTELANYLKEANKVLSSANHNPKAIELLKASMPPYVASVNRDTKSGMIYIVLPSGLTYPRQKVLPAISNCFQDVQAKAGTVGGTAIFSQTLPGSHETMIIQSSEGLALLVKTVGNSFYKKYMKTPEGQAAMAKLLIGPYDGKRESQVILMGNSMIKGNIGH